MDGNGETWCWPTIECTDNSEASRKTASAGALYAEDSSKLSQPMTLGGGHLLASYVSGQCRATFE